MIKFAPIFIILLFTATLQAATDNDKEKLQVEKDGHIITVIDFQDGDKIKLFEEETGEHILSKSFGTVDLSQLPNGKYILENSFGKSVNLERRDIDIIIEEPLGQDYVVVEKATALDTDTQQGAEDELKALYPDAEFLEIKRDHNIITVLDFEEGDVIKLFELKDTVHVLSKTTRSIDLSQLPHGRYFLKNNRGRLAFVEKYEDTEDTGENTLASLD